MLPAHCKLCCTCQLSPQGDNYKRYMCGLKPKATTTNSTCIDSNPKATTKAVHVLTQSRGNNHKQNMCWEELACEG